MKHFDITQYEFDKEHGYLEIGNEAMIFHCHHYVTNIIRTILDADYIDSRPFLIGSAVDSVYNQLSHLTKNLSIDESKKVAEEVYKNFGYGLIDLSNMNENGIKLTTTKSFFSKTWLMKFGQIDKPIDYYTTGYLIATYAVLYGKKLEEIQGVQTTCMAVGDEVNTHIISSGERNFDIYPEKKQVQFIDEPKHSMNWKFEETITNTFIKAHEQFIGDEQGFINAFGVYIVRNQSDFINRLQFEFVKQMTEVAGDYGVTLAGELLIEAGHSCGFFTYGGIMTSEEWKQAVLPYLKTKEDWIYGLISLINTMGWGYHTVVELTEEKAVFRNYNDFEDLSYLKMYGESDYPVHWANSGGFTGLMQLIYNTDLIETGELSSEEEFKKMRQTTQGYKTKMTKGISCGDKYLEVIVYK
jgi:hypothetical protein